MAHERKGPLNKPAGHAPGIHQFAGENEQGNGEQRCTVHGGQHREWNHRCVAQRISAHTEPHDAGNDHRKRNIHPQQQQAEKYDDDGR